jgi:putative DNA primase/helicase
LISLAQFRNKPRPKDKLEPFKMEQSDAVSMFKDTLRAHGLHPEEIVTDGSIHRFSIGKKSNSDGYYSLSIKEYGGSGIYGNWQVDNSPHHWTSYTEAELSPTQLAKIRRQRAKEQKEIREENKRRFESGIKKAEEYLLSCRKADNEHPYITKKQVGIFDDIQQNEKDLIIPVYSAEGSVQTYQRILADGKKKLFMSGGTAKGGFYPMVGDTSTICICEGYATGWSIHNATGYQVFCAFNAGGLKTIATLMKKEYPQALILICADNDHGKPQNTGIKSGRDAAKEVGGLVVFPEAEDGISDFNDLAVVHGFDAVVRYAFSGHAARV